MINQVFAADGAKISDIYSPVENKIPTGANLSALLSENLLTILFTIIGILFLISIVMSGWDYMLSTGDPKRVSSASTRFLNGVIGLILTITAFLIVRIVASVIGLGGEAGTPGI